MNEKQPCTIAELQIATKLPKPTVFRILATLEQEGYVRNEGGLGRYRLTEKTRHLGAAYGEKSLLIDVGSPRVLAVTKQIKWPLALGTWTGMPSSCVIQPCPTVRWRYRRRRWVIDWICSNPRWARRTLHTVRKLSAGF
ncbi:MAG: helix-turn-helix domain-containing protein [Proteobacteria bacterium]|nr:helix-turn-helix domain-containing protein [Pseudomonadota bacterium]